MFRFFWKPCCIQNQDLQDQIRGKASRPHNCVCVIHRVQLWRPMLPHLYGPPAVFFPFFNTYLFMMLSGRSHDVKQWRQVLYFFFFLGGGSKQTNRPPPVCLVGQNPPPPRRSVDRRPNPPSVGRPSVRPCISPALTPSRPRPALAASPCVSSLAPPPCSWPIRSLLLTANRVLRPTS